MTTSTTMTSGMISSTFLTAIQTQKVNLENAMMQVKGQNATTAVSGGTASALITFMQGYITFLQSNSQFTSLSALSAVSSVTSSSSYAVIGGALQQVISSIYQLEGQEMSRLVKTEPSYAYQGASQIYQAAFQANTFNAANNTPQGWCLSSTYSLTGPNAANGTQFYGLYKLQSVYAAASEIYTYLKAFVTEYSLTSKIDSLYLAMQNYPDGFGGGASGPAAVTALLNGELECVNWLSSFASSNATNAVSTANVLGGPATSPNMLLIGGGVLAAGALAWFLLSKGAKSSPVVAPYANVK